MGLVHSVRMCGELLNTFNMFILVLNAILFTVFCFFLNFIFIALRICKRLFIVFKYDFCIVN